MNLEMLKDLIGNWKTKKYLIKELANDYEIYLDEDGREWRLFVNNFNLEACYKLTDGFYIAHSCRGYKLTNSYEEVKKSLKDNHKRCMKMLVEEARVLRSMNEDLHYQEMADEIDEQIKKSNAETLNS
ncbi:MAG: hypothetical protein WC343_04385 [Bacilli bacterium]|jgi:hypothetical protein